MPKRIKPTDKQLHPEFYDQVEQAAIRAEYEDRERAVPCDKQHQQRQQYEHDVYEDEQNIHGAEAWRFR